MRITKKNFAIKLLTSEDVRLRPPVEGGAYIDDVRRFVTKLQKNPTRIFAMSNSFEADMIEASEAILNAWDADKIQLEREIRACLLFRGKDHDYAYFVELRPVGNLLKGRVMHYNSKYELNSYLELSIPYGSENDILVDGWDVQSILSSTDEDKDGFLHAAWKVPLSALLYMQFGEIETKRVCRQKVSTFGADSIDNRTNIPIVAVNSTWLNNIVRSSGFNVSGHFRLQRVGKGRSGTKLTWVNSYRKSGYSRSNDRWREMPSV